jgi:hypothetical protein
MALSFRLLCIDGGTSHWSDGCSTTIATEALMKLATLFAATGLFGLAAAPALADEYYIVQDQGTKECTIVSEKPTVETMVLIDEDGYATEVEAVEARKKVKVCVDADDDD